MENPPTMLGSKGLIKKHEFVRAIIQCLYSLGFGKVAGCLESESGISYKSEEFELIESLILDANWDDCIANLDRIKVFSGERRDSALFLVIKQCLSECLACENDPLAWKILREKVSEFHLGQEFVHKLAYSLLSSGEMDFDKSDDNAIQELRKRLVIELEKVLPPPITLPERRLEHLVEMAVSSQINSCIYHNSSDAISLYEDHRCGRDQIPTETIQILRDHKNEVWFVQFSNNGDYLASSSSDCTAIIWQVLADCRIVLKHTLRSHENPVSFVAWSSDDTMLLTFGTAELLRLWDVETGSCRHTFADPGFIVSSCAWFPNSHQLVCGSSDSAIGICMFNCQGDVLGRWRGKRMLKVLDISVTPDGKNLISISSEQQIWIVHVETSADRIIPVEHSITSLFVSGDSKYLIVNLNSQEIHLYDVAASWENPRKYKGHKQHKYVIRSCFGGLNSTFIASGSEDSKVYIWNRRRPNPIEVLSGHLRTVNCVSWNPKRPQMLASASDDQTIRIWGPSSSEKKQLKKLVEDVYNYSF